jgi:outer membrane protein TolC
LNPSVCREQVLAAALARRGELGEMTHGADIVHLESLAQAVRCCRLQVPTFASQWDLHADPLPAAHSDSEYRPGVVGLELPQSLFGSQCARLERGAALGARADAVVEKTHNRVVWEVEDAYHRWRTEATKLAMLREASLQADKLARDVRSDFDELGPEKIPVTQLIAAQVRRADLQFQVIDTHYKQLRALAVLELVSAGEFCAGFATPAAP